MYFVSWYDAIVFCNKLSMSEGLSPAYRISGSTDPAVWIAANGGSVPTSNKAAWNAVEIVADSAGYRLPTEAQWEYAAKGGDPLAPGWIGYTYSGSDTVDDVAWYVGNDDIVSGNDYGISKAVRTKAPNKLGIYDMSGNVYEWCWDWYEEYTSEAVNDPTGAVSSDYRVMRGGNWFYSAYSIRSVSRGACEPYGRGLDFGIRLVRP